METRSKKRKVESDFSKDLNSNKRLKATTNYCFLCQEYGHQLSANCSVNAVCFLCGVKGHVRRDCLVSQNENSSRSTSVRFGDWIDSAPRGHVEVKNNIPIISQEDVVLKLPKNRQVRAVTLLAKVNTCENVEYVRIIPKMVCNVAIEGVKLVPGVHKCIGNQESNIGANNVFVTILIERGQTKRTVKVGDTLGYAKLVGKSQSSIFNTFLTVKMKSGISKLKLGKNVQLHQDETTVVEATVESLPLGNLKNYPIEFESTNKSLMVDGSHYHTIQKGNSAKVRIRNISEESVILRNGYILGNAKSLITEEFIEKIQSLNYDADQSKATYLSLDLPYNFVFLEIEALRASNSSAKQITQIGCCSSLSNDHEKKFFMVIEPKELNNYLDNFRIAGDLLQFLHLQKNESGQFEYRKQFEIIEQGVEIPRCIAEREALQALALYLRSFGTNDILVSIKKETIELVIERMKHFELDFSFLKGFCTWDSFLEKTVESDPGSTQEFDDWYIEKVNNNVSSSLNAETVASMHKQVFNRISESSHAISTSINEITFIPLALKIIQASSPIESLLAYNSSANLRMVDSEEPPEFLELSNSFRPNFPTTITMISLETLEISSDEEEASLPTFQSQPYVQNPLILATQSDEHHVSNDLQNNVSPPSSNIMDIWISDDEPDETITSQNNSIESNEAIPSTTNMSEPSTSGVASAPKPGMYCQVCGKGFKTLQAFQGHLWTSKVHKSRVKIDKSSVSSVNNAWMDFQTRLGLFHFSGIGGFSYKTEIDNLTDIAINFQNKAGLIVKWIEKQVKDIYIDNRKQQISMRLLLLIGSLCRKNETFKELFKKNIVDVFAHAYRIENEYCSVFVWESENLEKFISLRLEWQKTRTFEANILHELDAEMRRHCPSWNQARMI